MEGKEVPELSKRQQKKLRKQEQWEAKKELIKQHKKEKKTNKRPRTAYQHIMRFNNLVREGEEPGGKHLTKKEKQDLFKALCEKGPKYVIDCQFESYMTDRELKSLGQQLAYCHSINKKLEQPLNIFVTGVGPRLKAIIEVQNCQHWAMNISFVENE